MDLRTPADEEPKLACLALLVKMSAPESIRSESGVSTGALPGSRKRGDFA